MTSKQIAQYRLLNMMTDTLNGTIEALSAIKNINSEFKTGELYNNNATNYTIEPVWLSNINKRVEAYYYDGTVYKQLYITPNVEPEFRLVKPESGTEANDYYTLYTKQGISLGLYIVTNVDNTPIVFNDSDDGTRPPLYAPMTVTGQAYAIEATIDDIVFSSILIDRTYKYSIIESSDAKSPGYYTIDTDFIPGCILSGGKLYKADTLEIIPVKVDGGNQLKLTETVGGNLSIISVERSMDLQLYNPELNTITNLTDDFTENSYNLSLSCTLSHGNEFYYTSPSPTEGKYIIIKYI